MCIRKTACLVLVCFLLTSLGAFCQTGEISPQTDKALSRLVKVRPGLKVDPEVIQRLVDKIIEDNALSLREIREWGFYRRCGAPGRTRHVASHPQIRKDVGEDSAGFWKDSWNENAALRS